MFVFIFQGKIVGLKIGLWVLLAILKQYYLGVDRIVFSWELFCPDGFGGSWNGMLRKWWFLGMWGTPSYIINSITFEWTFLFLEMEKFVRSGRRLILSGGFYRSGKIC